MNSYLVERYLPGLPEAEVRRGLARVQEACAELTAAGTEIRYRGSMFLPLEEACFCRFEAAGGEAVVAANDRARVPFARITAGVEIAPAEPAHEGSSAPHQPNAGGSS